MKWLEFVLILLGACATASGGYIVLLWFSNEVLGQWWLWIAGISITMGIVATCTAAKLSMIR